MGPVEGRYGAHNNGRNPNNPGTYGTYGSRRKKGMGHIIIAGTQTSPEPTEPMGPGGREVWGT
eukprot:1343489-Amorphochlora_amoeboformis.AAC.1